MRKTIIDEETGTVTNVVVLAEGANWTPPEGQAIGANGGQIGQRWNGSAYEWILPRTDQEPV